VSAQSLCSCITCRDEAIEMRVLRLDGGSGLALCETAAGDRRIVDVTLLDDVAEGLRVLVHADVAIARIRAAEVVG
jgi:hydrogenase maturation factor